MAAKKTSENLVAWEDPPAIQERGRKNQLAATADELKAHPNKWAKVRSFEKKEQAYNTSARFKKGFEGIETAVRAEGTGGALYARWVGGKGKK